MDLLVHMAQGALGAWLAWHTLRFLEKIKDDKPFKWACPDCNFRVETNDPQLTITLANNHEMRHQ